jgi:hypothetical protein
MKNKKLLIVFAVITALILSGGVYLLLWGGEPEIENFHEVKADYEILAELALDTYSELSPDREYVIFGVCNDGTLRYEDSSLALSDEEKEAAKLVSEEFDYLRVGKDAVFFYDDETGYYGLVYSKNPVVALYEEEIPQRGRSYHRISSCWYEWGVFGL